MANTIGQTSGANLANQVLGGASVEVTTQVPSTESVTTTGQDVSDQFERFETTGQVPATLAQSDAPVSGDAQSVLDLMFAQPEVEVDPALQGAENRRIKLSSRDAARLKGTYDKILSAITNKKWNTIGGLILDAIAILGGGVGDDIRKVKAYVRAGNRLVGQGRYFDATDKYSTALLIVGTYVPHFLISMASQAALELKGAG
jgi:hypothetical protein